MMRGGHGTHIRSLHNHVAHPSHKASALHGTSGATHLHRQATHAHVALVHAARAMHGAGYQNFLLGNGKAYTF
jgi:hypothetical protein